jgi:hypothetical protein
MTTKELIEMNSIDDEDELIEDDDQYTDVGTIHWTDSLSKMSLGAFRYNINPRMLTEEGFFKKCRDGRTKKIAIIHFDRQFVLSKFVELVNQTGLLSAEGVHDLIEDALLIWADRIKSRKNEELAKAYTTLQQLNPAAYAAIMKTIKEE